MTVQAVGTLVFVALLASSGVSVMMDLEHTSRVQSVLVVNEFDDPVNVSVQGIIRGPGIQLAAGAITDGDGNVVSPPAGYCSIESLPPRQTGACDFHSTFELDFDYVSGYDSTAYAKLRVTLAGPYDATWDCPASTTAIHIGKDGTSCEHAAGVRYP